ncbi:hypothetical protein G6F70_005299 [Rhizopus microsporus]|uniref:Phospholipase B1, membrane-associated n=1 Tax=Rhizopus azygosporus TaxID=86630 RepID=A0A367JY69_RHIAZ|nr:hypothetical protein G6F71_007680 [Rhizopus microsporus]RCH94839.1 hypothetical protein CU097_010364 [Rhizopus azygosporus]KAG1199026.1 hypothetical protein G6F70_005299 [Rhizopus microsporus]KAG1210790.1 hypothetical protein G6F69_005178 [Rhizopus microsporus]KAG1237662.1 hypothetical protein G6F67_001063 [Rhizopus microsporus]
MCPALSPRPAPTSAHDLRPDDIKVIGALGDSITAGFGIMGINLSQPPSLAAFNALNEYRGLSYSIGGDEGALTVPNYVKHYQPNLKGYSIDSHIALYCSVHSCPGRYIPEKDRLNAALSGSLSINLQHQLDYLIPEMHNIAGIDFQNDWKMINIQIGSNDMCSSCDSRYMNITTPDQFASHMDAAIERIVTNVPRVLVNVIGAFNVSQLFPVTAGQAYCRPTHNDTSTIGNRRECTCGSTPDGLKHMDYLAVEYNKRLFGIYQKYQQNKNDSFAVVYQHSNLNMTSFPINFFSNIDCFHPGLVGHQWVSKIVWNELFQPQAKKASVFNFNANQTIYCPTDSDRIATN